MNPDILMQNFNNAKPADRAGYHLTALLAEGGQAWVYDAEHPDGSAAIKVFKQHQSDETVDQFCAEGRKLKELAASDHIIKVSWLDSLPLEAGNKRTKFTLRYPYMAMERADGGSVKDYVGSTALTPQRALSWIVQAMEGIRYAHGEDEQGGNRSAVVHRDIKPANLLVVNGKVKVADFGIAVTGHSLDESISKTQTRTGTLSYMPPEQFNGRAVLASDIYAMAVTGFQMITGILPINCRNGDWHDWYVAHLNEQPQLVPMLGQDGTIDTLAMAMQEVLLGGLTKQPQDRFASMGLFQSTLIETAARVQTQHNPHTAYLDMQFNNGAEANTPITNSQSAAKLHTKLLSDTHPSSTAAPAEEEQPEQESRAEITRRRALGFFLGSAAVFAAGTIVQRAIFHKEAANNGPVAADESVVSAVKWVIDRYDQQGQTRDVFHLTRHLIPVAPKLAHSLITEMPLDKASWLAADLALYMPGSAEKILRRYEANQSYIHAARIALALAYYSKEKTADGDGSHVSGVPVDPGKRAAFNAAARVSVATANQDIKDLLDIASQSTYTYSNFGKPVDRAQEKLTELMADSKHDLVEMFCRIIVRDNPIVVAQCAENYLKQARETKGDTQSAMLQMARDIAVDLAPFDGDTARKILFELNSEEGSDFSAAANTLALALAPYRASVIAEYVGEDLYTHQNRLPLGIAVAPTMPLFHPEFKRHATEPVLSWLQLVSKPSATTVKRAKQALSQSTDFTNYAYWVAAAALKAETFSQK